MMATAAVAAIDFDVLALRTVLVEARLPGADAVAAAEDRGGRHRRRAGQRAAERIVLFDLAAARQFIGTPGVGGFRRAGQRTGETDHAEQLFGRALGKLAGIEAAQTPADEAHLAPAVALEELIDAG